MIAKIFAALAVAALVVGSVASFAPAAGAQTTTTSSASVTFSRDLTIGSTGADVTALQNWLISKGHTIAAGATGYFGAQTQAALAAYQAANGIAPAAGYFGPITRAKVNAAGGATGGTGSGNGSGSDNGGDLSGGETDLNDFELVSEDSSGDEGEEGVEIATAEFDVDDADARIERVELTFDASNGSLEDRPWDYFDTIYVMVDGDEVADVDASDRDEWDETTDDVYVLTISGLDVVVDEGDQAALTFAADIAGSIDTADQAQTFSVFVDEEGIRATDSEGIQQYIGDENDTVSFGFGAEDNGDLTINSSDEDPDSSIIVGDADDESQDYTVFAFDIENDGDADSLITEVTVHAATSSATLANTIRTATLVVDGDEFDGDINNSTGAIVFEDIDVEIAADDEMAFEVMVTLKANPSANTITFSLDDADGDVEAEGLDSGDDADVDGSATGSAHTVALTGIVVEAVSTSEAVVTPGDSASATYGTYTIKFDVTALEDDAYIASTSDAVAAGDEGVSFTVAGSATFAGTTTSFLSSTGDSEDGFFVVDEGDTETFTLTVTLDPSTAGTFEVDLSTITFNDLASFVTPTVYTVDSNDEDFQTDPIYVAN